METEQVYPEFKKENHRTDWKELDGLTGKIQIGHDAGYTIVGFIADDGPVYILADFPDEPPSLGLDIKYPRTMPR